MADKKRRFVTDYSDAEWDALTGELKRRLMATGEPVSLQQLVREAVLDAYGN